MNCHDGKFIHHQQTNPIALVQKFRIGRVMGAAHHVQPHLILEDARVAALQTIGGRSPYVGKGLMPAHPAQLQRPTIKAELARLRVPVNPAYPDPGAMAVH